MGHCLDPKVRRHMLSSLEGYFFLRKSECVTGILVQGDGYA